MFKYLQIALSMFVGVPTRGRGQSGIVEPSSAIEILKLSMQAELAKASFRLLLGAMLTAVVVFALYQLGFAFIRQIEPLEYAVEIGTIVFGILAVFGTLGLYLIFRKPQKLQTPQKASLRLPWFGSKNQVVNVEPARALELDFKAIGSAFMDGLITGFVAKNAKLDSQSSPEFQTTPEFHATLA